MRYTAPIIVSSLSVCLFIGCDNDKKSKSDKLKAKNILRLSISADTLFIRKRSAVAVWLNSATLARRRKHSGNDADSDDDDFAYYADRSDSVLRQRQLPVIDAVGYKYLKFIQKNGSVTIIKTGTLSEIYNLYFFEPSRSPEKADIASIEDAYKKFYKD